MVGGCFLSLTLYDRRILLLSSSLHIIIILVVKKKSSRSIEYKKNRFSLKKNLFEHVSYFPIKDVVRYARMGVDRDDRMHDFGIRVHKTNTSVAAKSSG